VKDVDPILFIGFPLHSEGGCVHSIAAALVHRAFPVVSPFQPRLWPSLRLKVPLSVLHLMYVRVHATRCTPSKPLQQTGPFHGSRCMTLIYKNTACLYSRARTNTLEDTAMLEHSDSPFGTSDLEACFHKLKNRKELKR
jgi:hypothetical protein